MSDTRPNEQQLEQLLEAAFSQTLERFREQMARGDIDAVGRQAEFRQRRRDYASLLRLGKIPEEARSLGDNLLKTHRLDLPPDAREAFHHAVTRLLVRLYDAFIARVEGASQGNR